jgi:sortase A
VTRFQRLVGTVVLVVTSLLGFASVGHAAPSVSGPVVKLNRTEVAPGDLLLVTIDGFKARTVTIATCGNEARRGSADCDMVDSKGVRIQETGSPTVTKVGVFSPPVGCPCVIRVSSQSNDEVVVVPITLIGHPIEPLVGGPSVDEPLVGLTITAREKPRGLVGWARSSLGGQVTYEVTVTVTNLTTGPLRQVHLFGSVGRNARDELATLTLKDPGEIGAGQTWKQVLSADVPAPSLTTVQWQIVASRAGPLVAVTSTTRHRPVLFMLLMMTLVVDISLLVLRFRMRRRAALEAMSEGDDFDDERADAEGYAIDRVKRVDVVPV